MSLLTVMCLIALAIILERTIHVAATLDIHRYAGHRWRFCCLAVYWSLLAAGGLATTLGLAIGGPLLLLAIALLKISDRRRIV